jgi:hypothetical protein
MRELALDLQEPCPECGKARAEWTDLGGEGYEFDGETYCSQDCAIKAHARG